MSIFPEGSYNASLKEKYREPQHQLRYRDPGMPADKMLEVDVAHLKAAKDKEVMQPLRIRFIEDGPDRTIDEFSKFPKTCIINNMSAQETIYELRQAVSDQEGIALEDVNLFVRMTPFDDDQKIGDCFVDWMGFGMDEWPPRFICKPKVKGFEVFCNVPKCRDLSTWENGRMLTYMDRNLIFDCETSTTVMELKEMVSKRILIPAKRLKIDAHVRKSLKEYGDFVELDDDTAVLSDYGLHLYYVSVQVTKKSFDKDGNYIFDDAFFDDAGYHAQPMECWISQDALCDRSRPDAHKVDPNQPLSIVTDRRQAEATKKWEDEEASKK